MARTRRRMTKSPGKRRKADWVYRPDAQTALDPVGGAIFNSDSLGSYEPTETTIAAGAAAGKILYDSANRIKHVVNQGGGVAAPILTSLPQAARAEGHNPLILAVDGVLWVRPSAWAIGNVARWGWRIGVFEQDPETGALSIDANYSMFQIFGTAQPAVWANDRQYVREWRFFQNFHDGANGWMFKIRAKFRRRLLPFQCFGLYFEAHPTTINAIITPWLRTLVADDA